MHIIYYTNDSQGYMPPGRPGLMHTVLCTVAQRDTIWISMYPDDNYFIIFLLYQMIIKEELVQTWHTEVYCKLWNKVDL